MVLYTTWVRPSAGREPIPASLGEWQEHTLHGSPVRQSSNLLVSIANPNFIRLQAEIMQNQNLSCLPGQSPGPSHPSNEADPFGL